MTKYNNRALPITFTAAARQKVLFNNIVSRRVACKIKERLDVFYPPMDMIYYRYIRKATGIFIESKYYYYVSLNISWEPA